MKNIFLVLSLLVLLTLTITPASASPEKHYFIVVPQSDVPPNWRPSPNEKFPIINTDYLMKLTDEYDFIKDIAAFRPQFVEVGNNVDDKTRVLNYCFSRDNFIFDKIKKDSIEKQGDVVLFSDTLFKSLGLEKQALPLKIKKFVELFNPSSQNSPANKKNSTEYVSEDIFVNGITPAYLKFNKSGEFMLTNNCILPLNEDHAEKLRFEPEYSMPPTLIIESLSSNVNDFNSVMLNLKEFYDKSRSGLTFEIRKIN